MGVPNVQAASSLLFSNGSFTPRRRFCLDNLSPKAARCPESQWFHPGTASELSHVPVLEG